MARGPKRAPGRFILSLDILCFGKFADSKKTLQERQDDLTRPVADSRIKRSTYNTDVAAESVNAKHKNNALNVY